MAEGTSRRRFLGLMTAGLGAAGLAGTGLLGGSSRGLAGLFGETPSLGMPPANLPGRQHAWNDFAGTDTAGNAVMPRFHRLLMFDVAGRPGAGQVQRLEAALRTLERSFAWHTSGLLFLLGWGPGYFARRLGIASPVERPVALSPFETPEFDDYDACLHLASDDEQLLVRLEASLVQGDDLPGADGPVDLRPVFRWRETRTGFVGDGIPAERYRNPAIPAQSPLFMGFKSNFRRNQATEDDVTIETGPLAGGTTLHVSRLRLRLDSWYSLLDEDARAARMFAPQVKAADVAGYTTEAPTYSEVIEQTAAERGVVGHLQAAAQSRRGGKPIILRRDFNTLDGGQPGLHFVALQRSIADFVETRRAMNASRMSYANPAVKPRENNGIKEFIFVLQRANYIVPPRAERAFPLLPGREEGLA